MIAVVDVDDLWTEQQILDHLLPLKEAVPQLVVTAYAIPNRLGPVHELKARYPWIVFAQHGWEHTFCECLEWTKEKATALLLKGREMGYEALFKPPNWQFDDDLLHALSDTGTALHHHRKARIVGWPGGRYWGERPGGRSHTNLHTHIEQNPVTDFIATHPGFQPGELAKFSEFETPFGHLYFDGGNGEG